MKKILSLTLVVILAMLMVVSCGQSGGKGDSFILVNGAEPETLDPALMSGVPEHKIYMSLFEGLVSYDPKTCQPVPGVAESWSVSDDGLTWTFKLRKNAMWSDGKKITAQDFVDSWLRLLNPDTGAKYAWMMTLVVKGSNEYNSGKAGPEAVAIKAVDENTFQMELVGPAPYALGMLAHYVFGVHPLHVIDKYGAEWTHPGNMVSNGPFVLEEWKPQESLLVKKNDKYWDKDNVKLSSIEFLPIDDNNTAMNMYINGEVDWIEDFPSERMEEAKKLAGFQLSPALITYYYVFNCKRPPFDNPMVRKALAMAIKREEITDQINRKGDIPSEAIVPPMPGYTQATGNGEDVEMAKKYLADAGFPNGEGFPKVTILYNTSENHKLIAQYVQQKWEENLGLKVELENQEWKTYLVTREHGEFDVARAGWVGDYLDPNTFLEMFLSDSAMNGGKYQNPEYDRLIKKAATMQGGPERLAVLNEAENLLLTEEQGIMPFYHYSRTNLIDTDKWGGWFTNTLDIHPWKTIYKK
ncbi:MAG: peptide ABC transporter substrate-binding protein [Spirochaetes bacterium]|nr:peptide ABC transporter substrate-binding protein [Spirochaetota bacterium]